MELRELIEISRQIASPAEDCVILGEGNTSAKLHADKFLVKASGKQLFNADEETFVKMVAPPLIAALDGPDLSDADTKELLVQSSVNPLGLAASTESFMHAFLLSLPGINCVIHTHPTPLLPLLCSYDLEDLARKRLFPDEIVCCGPRACVVPYTDPGLPLGKAVRTAVLKYEAEENEPPKTIWIQNHGLICLGKTGSEAVTATRMSVKAARVWGAAMAIGKPIKSLTESEIQRIHQRPDEHYRQRMLWKS
ncbi:hypothetical protein BH11ARM1_BH11ARM1_01890 [soil metagenome]